MSVRLCRHLVTRVSAPLGQFSTRSSSSGEFMPIPRIWRERRRRPERGAGRRGEDKGPRVKAQGNPRVKGRVARGVLGLWGKNW